VAAETPRELAQRRVPAAPADRRSRNNSTLDAALALDAMAGYEPGDHHWIGPPPHTFAEATTQPLGRVAIRFAVDAPLGIPVDGVCTLDVIARAAAAAAGGRDFVVATDGRGTRRDASMESVR